MSEHPPAPRKPSRRTRTAYILLVIAVIVAVAFAWFSPSWAQVPSSSSDTGYMTVRCGNAGMPKAPSRQELASAPALQVHNQELLMNAIDSMQVHLACSQSRDAHTNTLILTTFGASTAMVLGFVALHTRNSATPQRA